MSIRWRPPATGALRADLRGPLGTFRDQLANPLIARIAPGLLAEASHDGALAEVIYAEAAAPRWAAARAILRGAVDRGELPAGLDLELGTDLLIAPLAFRTLMRGRSDDEYLETLTNATEAALKAAAATSS